MHRSKTADALLSQLIAEKKTDVVIISEQYKQKNIGNWVEDHTGTAALWLPPGSGVNTTESGSGNGFVWACIQQTTLISCYLTPSDNIEEFQNKLNDIEDMAREIGGSIIVAGDFNSKAIEWGMPTTNSRGRRVLDMAARLGLTIMNTGAATTFRRPGCEETTPDITLVSDRIAGLVKTWKVLEDFTGSDHQYISFRVERKGTPGANIRKSGIRKWNVSKLNREVLIAGVDAHSHGDTTLKSATEVVKAEILRIKQACNKAMPTLTKKKHKSSVYWWTEEIAKLRRDCLRLRRKYTRARRTGQATVDAEAYKYGKKQLRAAIAESKKEKWEELRADLNRDPWGLGYKIVVKKLGARVPTPALSSSTMDYIVKELFPSQEIREEIEGQVNVTNELPLFTIEELQSAASKLKNNKAPGPDGVPAEVLKEVAKMRPQVLLDMYNACLKDGIFPEIWKTQQLVLISKGKGNPNLPSAYRPLCMLDTAGKLLERLIKPRLAAAIDNAGGLSERQHGFRRGKSTIGAIETVISSVEAAQQGSIQSRNIVLLATLDVRNAFNSVRWADILAALELRFKVPAYLQRIMRSYMRGRKLVYQTPDGSRCIDVTAGAAQGSILGPDLWNISYDEILNIEMPDNTFLIGYTDDIAAVITARNLDEVRRKLNQVMIRTQTWLDSRGLKLATEKTELILLTKKHIPLEVSMQTCSNTLTTTKVLKYLGIRLDPRLTFWAQIKHAAEKAAKMTSLLSRLMANIGGPTQKKREIIMATTLSVLLYGAELWANALKANYRCKLLASVQRTAALKVVSAYRTVSGPAVQVISGSIPIDLLAFQRKKLWALKNERMEEGVTKTAASEIKNETLRLWQDRWRNETRGRWTARLIRDVAIWHSRNFGEVNFYTTQMLSGHGYFQKYLFRIGKCEHPTCIYGDADEDDAEHTFFQCTRWVQERCTLENAVGHITTENVIDKMLSSKKSWETITGFAEKILRIKKRDLDAGTRAEAL